MSLKFGSLFNDIGAGFKKSMDTVGKKFEDQFKSGDISGIEKATDALEKLKKASKDAATAVRDAESDFRLGTKNTLTGKKASMVDIDIATEKLNTIREAESKATEELANERENLIEIESQSVGISKKYGKGIVDINKEYENAVKALHETKQSQAEYNDSMKKLKTDMFKKKLMASISGGADGLKEGLGEVENVMDNMASKLPPQFQLAYQAIKYTAVAAVKQMFELNDSLAGLQRATGGFVTASKLGYDAFGNSTNGIQSLKSAAIDANISIEEFGDSIKSLVDDSFGATMGGVKIATGELQGFGIEAAQMKKYFGADIGPSVRKLYQDYGMSIKNSTKFLSDASNKALSMGLNVAGFVKNFEAVTNLVGKIYFKNREEMQKMAMIASQLGVSVDSIAGGLVKMNGITDLFSEQQKAASLGLNAYAKNLSKIYALQKLGKSGEASKLEFSSLAKSLQGFGGLDKDNTVNTAGIETLTAMGIGPDAAVGIQKMAREAKATGIDIGRLGDVTSLSIVEQKRLAKYQAEQMTATEKLDQAWNSMKQTFIDIFAELAPVLEVVVNVFGVVAGAIKYLINGLKWAYYEIMDWVPGVDYTDKADAARLGMLEAADKTAGHLFAGGDGNPVESDTKAFKEQMALKALEKQTFESIGATDALKELSDTTGISAEALKTHYENLKTVDISWKKWWDRLFDTDKTFSDWMHDFFFRTKPAELTSTVNKGGKLPINWDEIYGKTGGPSMKTPNIPSVSNSRFLKAPSATISEAKASGNYIGVSNTKPNVTNVAITTNVESAYGSKQSQKYTV